MSLGLKVTTNILVKLAMANKEYLLNKLLILFRFFLIAIDPAELFVNLSTLKIKKNKMEFKMDLILKHENKITKCFGKLFKL